jgi:hypothetical protein
VNRLKPQRPDLAALADLCLSHLAEDPELLGQFMTETGYDPQGLRKALGTSGLQAGLVDYFARNEPMMLALCTAQNLRPEDFMAVWHKLNRTM